MFSPYYWRQMRKVCVLELLTAKNVLSFSSIRRNEASRLVQLIQSSTHREPINITEQILMYKSSITCKATFGKLLKNQKKFIPFVKKLMELVGGLRSRILKVQKIADSMAEDVINEHKKNIASGKKGNGVFGGEDLVDVLLRLMERGELKIPITNDNIKAVMIEQKLHQQ